MLRHAGWTYGVFFFPLFFNTTCITCLQGSICIYIYTHCVCIYIYIEICTLFLVDTLFVLLKKKPTGKPPFGWSPQTKTPENSLELGRKAICQPAVGDASGSDVARIRDRAYCVAAILTRTAMSSWLTWTACVEICCCLAQVRCSKGRDGLAASMRATTSHWPNPSTTCTAGPLKASGRCSHSTGT